MMYKNYFRFNKSLVLLLFCFLSLESSSSIWSESQSSFPTLAPMVEKAAPSVVRVTVKGDHKMAQRLSDPIQQFFNHRGARSQKQPFQALGSGVIINAENGYIVTNAHVINEADDIQIVLKDGRQFDAKLIGKDSETDIALLQIEAKNLVEIPLFDSDNVRVGDYAVAIGNPFGLNQTVTSGIISALGRSGLDIEHYEDFIQTDAAINSGNSGGALVNLQGELIGINTAILGPNGGNIGIGFAIPSNMMKGIVDQLIKFGEIRRGLLGILGSSLTADLAKSFDISLIHGVFINEVTGGSAAEKSGIKPGDIITHLNGKAIKSINELRSKIAPIGAGNKVALVILRDEKKLEIEVKLQSNDSAQMAANTLHPALDGAVLSNSDKGVIISSIVDGSIAQRLGFKQNDIIIGVNRTQIVDIKELRSELKNSQNVAALHILRNNTHLYLILR